MDRVILRNRAEQGIVLARQRDSMERGQQDWAAWFARLQWVGQPV